MNNPTVINPNPNPCLAIDSRILILCKVNVWRIVFGFGPIVIVASILPDSS
jgi:hypothetical protein